MSIKVFNSRQRPSTILCPSCGKLVGADDDDCWSCGQKRPGLFGLTAFFRQYSIQVNLASIVIASCCVIYGLCLLIDLKAGLKVFFSPSMISLNTLGASGAIPVFGKGHFWTLFSATWLHGGLLHLAMNMLWINQQIPLVVDLYGTSRAIIIYIATGVTGFLLTSSCGLLFVGIPMLRGAMVTVGASAALFGLFGAVLVYGIKTGQSRLTSAAKSWALIGFAYGLIIPQVDNWAHLGGFLGGALLGYLFNPLLPARLYHHILALVLILLSLGSLAASIFVA